MTRILWSAADPGGYDAVAPVVHALVARGEDVSGILGPPASLMAERDGLSATGVTDINPFLVPSSLSAASLFLAGTSGGASVDKDIMRSLAIPSLYVMDFWSQYQERFPIPPTAICVIDERMKEEMVAAGFAPAILHTTGNPHYDCFTEQISHRSGLDALALFISQPVSKGAVRYGFDEFGVLRDVIAAMPAGMSLSIRLHPRDEPHKYDSFLGERIQISNASTLEGALSEAGIVVGMFSPVLMQARAAGKRAISYLPHLAQGDPLPTNRIGLTTAVYEYGELRDALMHAPGEDTPSFRELFPAGATERVLGVIDELLARV